ncbi:MAG: CpsD/CapB family tyrosine-protein kinase [Planctomycetota bacterium]
MGLRRDGQPNPVPLDGAFLPFQRSLDALWANLSRKGDAGSPERLLFVSPTHGEGASTIASCTAIGFARHLREKVLLIEANLYAPSVAAYLGLPVSFGLSEVLKSELPLEEAILSTEIAGLDVLPAGTARHPEPGEFASDFAAAILAQAERGYRYILVDGPPLLLYPDSRILLRNVDEAVLVVRAKVTRRDMAENALQILKSSGVWVAGVVLNRFSSDVPAWLAKKGIG